VVKSMAARGRPPGGAGLEQAGELAGRGRVLRARSILGPPTTTEPTRPSRRSLVDRAFCFACFDGFLGPDEQTNVAQAASVAAASCDP